LKITESPSMATKCRPALRQAWTDAPSMNQERYVSKRIIIRIEKAMKESITRN
jgi:hypothetical protein